MCKNIVPMFLEFYLNNVFYSRYTTQLPHLKIIQNDFSQGRVRCVSS